MLLHVLGVLYILIIAGEVSPASAGGGTVLESIAIFVLQAVKSPAMAALVPSILIGFITAIGLLDLGVDRKAMKTATRAAIFAFSSLVVCALLLFATAGIGR